MTQVIRIEIETDNGPVDYALLDVPDGVNVGNELKNFRSTFKTGPHGEFTTKEQRLETASKLIYSNLLPDSHDKGNLVLSSSAFWPWLLAEGFTHYLMTKWGATLTPLDDVITFY